MSRRLTRDARALEVFDATRAQMAREADNTYQSDDCSVSGGIDRDAHDMAAAFPVAHDDGTGSRPVDDNPGAEVIATGTTGAPVGRPRRGTRDADTAEQLLIEYCAGKTIDELRACVPKGRPPTDSLVTRDLLAGALRDISRGHRATHQALAEALQCGVRTVDRLAARK